MDRKEMQILIVTEGKAGHLSQSRGLAMLVGGDRKIQVVQVNLLKSVLESMLRTWVSLNHTTGTPSVAYLWRILKNHISQSDIDEIERQNPDLVISAGTIPATANVIIAKRFKCSNVVAMKPSIIPLDAFKLAVLPIHDVQSKAPDNVVAISTSPNECLKEFIIKEGESFARGNGLAKSSGYWAIFLGGESSARKFPIDRVSESLKGILTEARKANVRCLITTSRRTPPDFENKLSQIGDDFKDCIDYLQIYSKNPQSTTKGILGVSSHVFITEDSVSMVSESLWANRKTYLMELPPKEPDNKIERFKNNLVGRNLISIVKNIKAGKGIEFNIDFEPDWNSFKDIETVRTALNRLISS